MTKPLSDSFAGASLGGMWTVELDDAETATVGLNGFGQLRYTFAPAVNAGYQRVSAEFEGPWIRQGTLDSSADDDFEVVLRCNSDFTADGAAGVEQVWGIILHSTDTSFLCFFISRESVGTRARFITNVPSLSNTVQVTLSDFTAGYSIKVVRAYGGSGHINNYSFYTSPDGVTWTQRGSTTPKTAGGLRFGLFAGNKGGASALAWTPEFEFVEEADDPLPTFDVLRRRAVIMGGIG